MSQFNLSELNALPKAEQAAALALVNGQLEHYTAQERVSWALENLPGEFVLSSALVFRLPFVCILLHGNALIFRLFSLIPVIYSQKPISLLMT